MFTKVLIANRGEIACRAIRTLKKLGLEAIALYSAADAQSLHVSQADRAFLVGEGPARTSYLDVERVLQIAKLSQAEAIFPGYGFLSENPEFADQCAARGLTFIGPTADQIRAFGLKHRARGLAQAAGVPLLPGSDLLKDLEHAEAEAERIGFPVMLKSTAGGGGIGLTVCESVHDLRQSYESTSRLSGNNFSHTGLFLEKFVRNARHIEVQIFGDGTGHVIALGERDCSSQRRNQKVIEETPAPSLIPGARQLLAKCAIRLGSAVKYRSAGTVEFVYDVDAALFYFLEVNTRLQVEHTVTEQTRGIDLIEWMIRTAQGVPLPELKRPPQARGHSIEVRVYAEQPAKNFAPSAGLLTHVAFPKAEADGHVRVDTWVETGTQVSPFYDPLLAKVIVWGKNRPEALEHMQQAVRECRFDGIETNLRYLSGLLASAAFRSGRVTTATLNSYVPEHDGIEVITPGTFTTVQDAMGRIGYWNVGIPPSGAMDNLSLQLTNRVVGNPPNLAGLELTMVGGSFRFWQSTIIALGGADMGAQLNGTTVPQYAPIQVEVGDHLALGKVQGPGARAYLCVRNGLDVPEYLGSRATFTLGGFGGHGGRSLLTGDTLRINLVGAEHEPLATPQEFRPQLTQRWTLLTLYGPHGAPDFFTQADIRTLYDAEFEVHYNSARTGVRLIGPKPAWARADGGEAGLHPSNIHDNAYAFGTVDFTGDMPILLGPDGPSLGGFVCPATVVGADLWKLGQLAPGDRVRFQAIDETAARLLRQAQQAQLQGLATQPFAVSKKPVSEDSPVLAVTPAQLGRPQVTYRPQGDAFLLVEYGPLELDLNLRFRIAALAEWLTAYKQRGIMELTPGIRSLQLHYDPQRLSQRAVLELLARAEPQLPSVDQMRIPTRIVHLPLSWDDDATQLAIEKYTQLVRKDAPWAPSNIEFIRRINGLASVEEVKRTVFDASYLVLGLGDVYLGAPVATPLDPRHRLVTTKYNPARTWTPENAVGIGGAYLCIYGMEGPGGYQFVGRTIQMYNRFKVTDDFVADKPWLLRCFDQIRFFPVSGAELLRLREAFAAGRYKLDIQDAEFDLAGYNRFLELERPSIQAFKRQQQAAFEAERQRWISSGQLHFSAQTERNSHESDVRALAPGAAAVVSPVHGSVWKVDAANGDSVKAGQSLFILESMKMEMAVTAPCNGILALMDVRVGESVQAGQTLAAISPG